MLGGFLLQGGPLLWRSFEGPFLEELLGPSPGLVPALRVLPPWAPYPAVCLSLLPTGGPSAVTLLGHPRGWQSPRDRSPYCFPLALGLSVHAALPWGDGWLGVEKG